MHRLALLLLLAACGDPDADAIDREVCSVSLPASTTVVSDTESFNAAAGDVLVCSGGQAVLNASGGRVYVTSGGQAVLNSSGVEVWLLDGGTAVLNAGQTDVNREPGGTTQGNFDAGTTTVCGTIELDTSELDAGC